MTRNVKKERAEIAAWLKANVAMDFPSVPDGDVFINKAGLLPFVRGYNNAMRFLVMRPRAEHPELGLPLLQICKGTRMGMRAKKWRDLAKNEVLANYSEVELLVTTALREGIEELGITLSATTKIYDAGVVNFTSARTGEVKPMHLFASEMRSENALLPMSEVDDSTSERRWLDLEEFTAEGRQDHAEIVKMVMGLVM